MLSLHSLLTFNYLTIIRLNLMAINSFNQIYIHFVIVVKDRAKLITPTLEPVLYKYISSIIENRKNKTLIINGSKDHLHILISMHNTESPSSLMLCVKQYTTKFLKSEGLCKNFSWQEGYAAFSYSKSQVKDVYTYIASQKEHHKKRTTQEEIDDIINKFTLTQLIP